MNKDKFLDKKYLPALKYQLDIFYNNYKEAKKDGSKKLERRWQAMGQAVRSRIQDIEKAE